MTVDVTPLRETERHQEQRAGQADKPVRRGLLGLAIVLIRVGPVLILAVLCLGLAVATPHFLSVRNIQNVGVQSAVVGILALGQLLVVIVRGIDLSIGAVVGFAAIAGVAASQTDGMTFIAVSLMAGLLVGALNGGLITIAKLPQPLIVTVATMGVFRGVAQLLTGGRSIVGLPPELAFLGGGFVGVVPVPVLVLFLSTALLGVLLSTTRWGRWLYAVGGNPDAARKLGIPTGAIIFSAYTICGLMAGVAGILTAGRTDTATPLAGTGVELFAITAVVIGGASLFGGRGNVWNVLVGALIIGVIKNGLDLLGVEPFFQTVSIGIVILVALMIDVARGALERRLRVVRALETIR